MARNNNFRGGNHGKGKGPKSKGNDNGRLRKDRDRMSHEKDSGKYQQDAEYVAAVERKRGFNDPIWYNHYPDLVSGAARIPFPNKPGMDLTPLVDLSSAGERYNVVIPGVWALEFVPTVGWSDNTLSPISVAATELYSRVRSKFSSSLDADAPDFIMYLMGLDSMYSYIAYYKRIYALLTAYDAGNYQMPRGVLKAMGLDDSKISGLLMNRSRLFYSLSKMIREVRRFKCPDVMDIFHRHMWMNTNIYTDGPDLNSQLYVFVQKGYYRWALATTEGLEGSSLQFSNGMPDTIAGIESGWDNTMQAFTNSDDNFTIAGYLERAFEGTSNVIISDLDPNETVQVVYNEEVLSQIENATVAQVKPESLNVLQMPSTNSVVCKPEAPDVEGQFYHTYQVQPTINLRSQTPGELEVVVATRLISHIDDSGYIRSGTEIVTAHRIVTDVLNASLASSYPKSYVMDTLVLNNTSASATELKARISILSTMSAFDWHPPIYQLNSVSNSYTGLLRFGDIRNITQITREQLERINRVCVYSEFSAFGF